MKTRTYSVIFIVFLSFMFVMSVTAQENESGSDAVLIDYLSGYCDEGAELTFIDFVQKNGDTLQPVLIRIVDNGVPDEMIQKLQPQLVKQYNERQRILNSDMEFGLSEEDMEIVKSESQEEYVQRNIQEYRDGFMSQAIFGLSLINTDQAQTKIKEIAADKENPYQRAAQNAVNKVYVNQ